MSEVSGEGRESTLQREGVGEGITTHRVSAKVCARRGFGDSAPTPEPADTRHGCRNAGPLWQDLRVTGEGLIPVND
jgi:hypothetical protein